MAGKFDQYKTALPEILENSRTKLTEKEVQVPEDFKLDDLPALIAKVEVGSKVEIVVTAPDYEGETLTAKKDQKQKTGIVKSGTCRIAVDESGIWTVSAPDKKSVQVEVKMQFEGEIRNYQLFGIRVKQTESDPKKRIEVLSDTDLYGLRPITVDQDNGNVDYGDMAESFLFKAMNHVVLKSIDQTEEIELNPSDYSQKLDGSPAPDAGINSNYNTFAKVEKLYIYEYEQSGYEYYYISDKKIDDNYTAIGFTREDDSEADSFYIATFIGSYDGINRLRSVTNSRAQYRVNYTDFQKATSKNGSGYSMEQHQMINFYEIAYLMMVQDFNCQKAIGVGRNLDWSSFKGISGFANNKGPIYYDVSTQAIKFMHVEDLWFNGSHSYEEGFVHKSSKAYIKMKPPYISSETEDIATYNEVLGALITNGQAKDISSSVVDNKWGRVPKEGNGSNTTYECHSFDLSTSDILFPGIRGNRSLFTRQYATFSTVGNNIVARLALIPEEAI